MIVQSGLLIALGVGVLTAAPEEAVVPDDVLLASVRPIPERMFKPTGGSERNGRLLRACVESLSRWAEVLDGRVEPVPGRPGQCYYGRGGHREDDVRPITYAAMVNAMLSRIVPMGRTGTAQEIVDAVLFLASPKASFITGEILNVNGGTLMD